MCKIITKDTDGGNTDIICSISGKPITESNEWGMYCENLCGIDKDKELTSIDNFLREILDEI